MKTFFLQIINKWNPASSKFEAVSGSKTPSYMDSAFVLTSTNKLLMCGGYVVGFGKIVS